jgi:steroid 5-alpha reductase family enzyme
MLKTICQNKSLGILVSLTVYIAALYLAILAGRHYHDSNPLLMLAAADISATLVVFIFSMAFNNSSIYDPYWSIKPMVIACYYFLSYDTGINSTRQYVVLILTLLYGLRLTLNFYRDWQGLSHEDWRYSNFRDQYPKMYWVISFVGIHFFPTIMVYLGCLPMFGAMAGGDNSLNLLDLLGTIVMFAAIGTAFIADEQLRVFRKSQLAEGKTMDKGLWKYSRHPNYLGEITTWWGLFCFALAAGSQYWWTGIGALAITLMFNFISIPLMEQRSLLRRPGYSSYIKSTPRVLPNFL